MEMAGSLSSRFGVRRLALGVVAAMLVAGSPATATNHVPGPAPAASVPPPLDEFGRGTPQGTLRGFLEAAALRNDRRAASYLDLRRIPAADVATRGPELAHQLRVVLDNTL